eukprot:c54208_g1_i1 orf=154-393(-)
MSNSPPLLSGGTALLLLCKTTLAMVAVNNFFSYPQNSVKILHLCHCQWKKFKQSITTKNTHTTKCSVLWQFFHCREAGK